MAYYDARLDSVALHFFSTQKNTDECVNKAAESKSLVWGDALVSIFSIIPESLGRFYLSIQDDVQNKNNILAMMKKAEYSMGLYYLRVQARRHAQSYTLLELYDIFVSKHSDSMDYSRAWEAIELGIAEQHILYEEEQPLEFTGKSTLFTTMASMADLFHKNGKTWIIKYSPPPAVIGVRFLSNILITHFGQLLLRSKEVDIDSYAKSPLFKKPRGIRTNDVARKKVMELYSAAVGIYVEDPKKINTPGISESIIEDYSRFNPSR